MRKLLLGTSAICAVAAAGPAFAQSAAEPIKLGIGGYFNSGYGDILSESGANGKNKRRDDINTDAVLNFKGSSKFDNGITAGLSVQLRAENTFMSGANAGDASTSTPDTIKRDYVYISGDFGEVRIGDDDDARRHKAIGAPIAGLGMFGANTPDLMILNIPGNLTNSTMKTISTTKRAARVAYFSPTIAGFSFAASYAPGGTKSGIGETNGENATLTDRVQAINNEISVAAGYSNKFGDFTLDSYVGASQGHRVIAAPNATLQTGRDNPLAVGGGAVVGWGPIKFGGAYEYLHDRDLPVAAAGGHQERKTWDVGAEYIVGPFSVSLDWTSGIYYEREVHAAPHLNWISLAAEYAIGPGVSIGAALNAVNYDSHVTNTAAVNGTSYSALGIMTGIGLAF